MKPYLREFRSVKELLECFDEIGPDPTGVEMMKEKACRYSILIRGVPSPVANIIKQEMLASGGDAAVSRSSIVCSEEDGSVLLMGSVKELRKVCERFKRQYFGLKEVGSEIMKMLEGIQSSLSSMAWNWNGPRSLAPSRPLIMGILNVTPDSFSDGGEFLDVKTAVKHAQSMIEDGADIIDIGGESTRPFSDPVSADEELKRVIPVIKELSGITDTPISIDTSKPEVARAALNAGASLVNDVYGARKEGMAELIADTGVPVVLMHMLGEPKTMQTDTHYNDVMDDIVDFFRERIAYMEEMGVKRDKIILDPGIGFGKTHEQNLEILHRLSELRIFGMPVLVGASRKGFIGTVTGRDVDERLYGSVSAAVISVMSGASIVRVHDVSETRDAVLMADTIIKKRLHD